MEPPREHGGKFNGGIIDCSLYLASMEPPREHGGKRSGA